MYITVSAWLLWRQIKEYSIHINCTLLLPFFWSAWMLAKILFDKRMRKTESDNPLCDERTVSYRCIPANIYSLSRCTGERQTSIIYTRLREGLTIYLHQRGSYKPQQPRTNSLLEHTWFEYEICCFFEARIDMGVLKVGTATHQIPQMLYIVL